MFFYEWSAWVQWSPVYTLETDVAEFKCLRIWLARIENVPYIFISFNVSVFSPDRIWIK
jgi:hypothetical protein